MGKLGIYLLANYPSKEKFVEAVRICERLKVDFLEVGFPFSDPVADGNMLEQASYETLLKFGFNDFAESLDEAREIFSGRIYVMTYSNVVYGPGIDTFVARTSPLAGLILADVPLRETGLFERKLRKKGMSLIKFLTPESRTEDIENALRNSTDFIYFISKRGTTGGGFALDEETREKIALARGKGTEVYIGFGIVGKDDVDAAFRAADGAIIGTRAVETLREGTESFERFVAGLR